MKVKNSKLLQRLHRHKEGLEVHFRKASKFLVKCQVVEPHVEKGTLHGCVCPWEIGQSAAEGAFPILEDFHDTLEAMWVWSYYTGISRKLTFKSNIDCAWEYIVENWKRFIGEEKAWNQSLYDCSLVLFSGILHQEIFNDHGYEGLLIQAGNRLEKYLSRLKSTEGREYHDPFWITYCLNLGAKSLKQEKWSKTAKALVKTTIANDEIPFSRMKDEPRHKGPGGHDFFSKNASKALALMSCLSREEIAKEIILEKFLPCLPEKFVSRHVDENAWNANLASAIGKSYVFTDDKEFLHQYFVIMDELKVRDVQNSAALPRSPSFLRRESWVTFFYGHAYVSVL